jgi:predicted amidohydrolase
MRAPLAAIRCGKGEVEANLAAHLQVISDAQSAGCSLVLFPEMSLTGSVDPAVCFGIAERSAAGQPHITQVIAAGGEVAGVQRKRYLGEGEEAFTAACGDAVFEHDGVRFGVAICAESGFDGPFDAAAAAGARLVLFPAAPGLYGRRTNDDSWRAGLTWWQDCGLADARRHARRLRLWLALAAQAGATDDEDFPGLAALVGPDGSVAARLPDWHAGTLGVEIPV